MKYLTAADILLIHSIIIDESGGSHGVRDQWAILSLENLPKQKAFGKELYRGVFKKSALYIRNIICGHPFIDGNKRTGMTAANIFLQLNGYFITVEKGEVERFALRMAKENFDLDTIADWLKEHSKKLR